MKIIRMPAESWKQGHGEIVHARFLTVLLECHMNSIAAMIAEKYKNGNLEQALSVLIKNNEFNTILYLYNNTEIRQPISVRDLMKVPLSKQSEEYREVLLLVSKSQIITNDLLILLLIHFPVDSIMDYAHDLVTINAEHKRTIKKEYLVHLKKMMARLGEPIFHGTNYSRIMTM